MITVDSLRTDDHTSPTGPKQNRCKSRDGCGMRILTRERSVLYPSG